MPDSSIMLELCKLLGITVNELLSGEKVTMDSLERKADENLIALKRKDENNIAKNVVISTLFTITLLIGMMVCVICDITTVSYKHLTPAGMKVRISAEIIAVDRKKVTFSIIAQDEKDIIGKASHERFVVMKEKFEAKAQAKPVSYTHLFRNASYG